MFYQKDNKKDISTEVLSVSSGVHDEISSYAQKIATALYLVTGLMDTHDPLKNRLRSKALDMMSFTSSYSNLNDKKTKVSAEDTLDVMKEVVSLIEIGSSAGVISTMNGDILIREIKSLITAFDTYVKMSDTHESPLGALFSQGLTITLPPAVSYKGQQTHVYKGQKRTSNVARSINVLEKKPRPRNETDSSERKERIVSLVKEKGNAMIKDISKHIPNCSEKTVQRDLIDLVSQGRLQKHGERRWTTYFIPKA